MRNIIFIQDDIRDVKKTNQGKDDLTTVKPILQVYKRTFKKYKVGDYLVLHLERQPYCSYKSKIVYLLEHVLAKVIKVEKNVIVVSIVKG